MTKPEGDTPQGNLNIFRRILNNGKG